MRQIFGYSVADQSAPWRLQRPEIPLQHPYLPWCWADALTSAPFNPLGFTNPNYTSPPSPDTRDWWQKQQRWAGKSTTEPLVGSGYNPPPYTTNWAKTQLAVRFKPFHGRIYSEEDDAWQRSSGSISNPRPEYQRFLGPITVTPKNELITVSGGVTEGSGLYWADSSLEISGPPVIAAGPPNVGSADTAAFRGSVYTTKQVTEVKLLWKTVEESYVIDDRDEDYFIFPRATRLLAHLGTINSESFCGCPRGTLLFDGIGMERYQQPLPTDQEFGLWAYDLTLVFKFFDPKRPPTANIITNPPGQDPLRGWSVFPWRNSGLWYGATRGTTATRGSYSGSTQFRETKFQDMFLHVREEAGAYPA